ncbi:MAG: hypothetical protein UX31_C0011G0013 [Candidatus Nomurabacteria bacterium GW2011_GWA1_46_11]|uniref:Uncharacterized protein n=1 Tax=Candidatus Nomurabacteria bacterium GW2011_GWA1_46_11 TaxID=1618732 RepID=A0A0G1NN02_9BACT|nr:MAG: hypothetical protein UX31_C0011G0013 [Candidatus Nomurabacteria bacterium GW2011_GWA1_46_11]
MDFVSSKQQEGRWALLGKCRRRWTLVGALGLAAGGPVFLHALGDRPPLGGGHLPAATLGRRPDRRPDRRRRGGDDRFLERRLAAGPTVGRCVEHRGKRGLETVNLAADLLDATQRAELNEIRCLFH